MKTLTPFTHGLSNGASLTTDISGQRFNAPYVKAVSSRYAQSESETNDYIRGQKIGLAGSVILALTAMLFMAVSVLVWNSTITAIALVVLWQGISIGNAFYAIKYEREFIAGKV